MQLNEELAAIEQGRLTATDFEEILAYVSSLRKIYGQANPINKRQLLKNTFDKITLRSGKLEATSAEWLTQMKEVNAGQSPTNTSIGTAPYILTPHAFFVDEHPIKT